MTAEAGTEASSGGRFRSLFLIVLGGIGFATSGPLARYARPADPLVVACGRLVLAATILLALDPRGIARDFLRLTRRQRAAVFGGGALLGLHFATFQGGLDRTSLASAVSLIALEPLSVVLVAWLLFRIRPTGREFMALAVATGGAFVVASASGEGDHGLVGDVLVVVSVALYGFYIAAARGLRDALPMRSYVALVYASAALTLAPLVPIFAKPGLPEALLLEPHSVLATVLLALVPTLVGHTAVQAAARVLSPSIVALVSPGETLGAIAIGIVLFGTTPTAREILGAAVLLAGTLLVLLGRRPPAPDPTARPT